MIFDILFNPWKVDDLFKQNKCLHNQLNDQSQKLEELMLNLDALRTEITENNDAISSAVALISTLVDELRAAAGNQAEIDAIVNALDAQTVSLAAAVVANTPVAPVIVEEPVVEPEVPVEE
jgi:chromosome segregation ATPase